MRGKPSSSSKCTPSSRMRLHSNLSRRKMINHQAVCSTMRLIALTRVTRVKSYSKDWSLSLTRLKRLQHQLEPLHQLLNPQASHLKALPPSSATLTRHTINKQAQRVVPNSTTLSHAATVMECFSLGEDSSCTSRSLRPKKVFCSTSRTSSSVRRSARKSRTASSRASRTSRPPSRRKSRPRRSLMTDRRNFSN